MRTMTVGSKCMAFLLVAIGLAVARPGVEAQRGAGDKGEWREYGADFGGTKYSPLSQINKTNIEKLQVAWRWPSPDRDLQKSGPAMRATRHEDTPLYVNGVLYTVTPLGMVAALDPATGSTRWLYDPEVYKNGKPSNSGFIHRGLAYWTDGKIERILHSTNDAYVISIDARTGKPDPAFGDAGRVDLTLGIRDAVRSRNFMGRRPQIAGNVMIVGSSIQDQTQTKQMPPGDVMAFDVRTGKRLWTFHVIPHPGEFGYDTWLDGSAEYTGNTNVWAGISYDPELDYVYLPVSGPTQNLFGGDRPGDGLFGESLVCVEAKTGKRVWHFQMIHHGIWDYDVPAQPVLGDITVDGRRIKAVMQVTKQAFTYVFDRRTGKPVWPIEERSVPQTTVARERTAPTQPFPTKPPAFDLQGTTEDNLIDFTPELRARATEQLAAFVHGPMYTPPSVAGTLYLPGTFGGANWGGAAFDPETGMLYVPSQMTPSLARPPAGRPPAGGAAPAAAGPNPSLQRIDGLPLFKPPYSRVTAIDMNRGEHAWMTPLGNGPRNHPLLKPLTLPPLGDAISRHGVMLTKTLLFVSAQRLDSFGQKVPPPWAEWGDPDMDQKLIFVFDKANGQLLREIKLDGMSASAPMTYMHRGRQYIVSAVGGGEESEVVALALP